MKLFDEIQAQYLTPETGPGRIHGRLGTNSGLGVDPKLGLEKMHRDDMKFQAEIDKQLINTAELALADLSHKRER